MNTPRQDTSTRPLERIKGHDCFKKSALERRVRNLQALLARERNSARAWREGAEALEAWNNRPHLEGCSAAQECTCDEEGWVYELTGEHDYWCPQSPHMGLECDCGRDA